MQSETISKIQKIFCGGAIKAICLSAVLFLINLNTPFWAQTAGPKKGLEGYYFNVGYGNTQIFKQEPVGHRVDPVLDIFFEKSKPVMTGLGPAYFYVRWAGMLTAPVSGDYTFNLVAMDGARLILDGKLLINAFKAVHVNYPSVPVHLEAGQVYEISVEFQKVHATGGGIRLSWKEPGKTDFEVIPTECLSPAFPPADPKAQPLAVPQANPLPAKLIKPGYIELSCTDKQALIYYTEDGSIPSRTHGYVYLVPIAVAKETSLKVIAVRAGKADSPVLEVLYKPQPPAAGKGLNIFRTGNSLTMNALQYLTEIAAAAGQKHSVDLVADSGASTVFLWTKNKENPDSLIKHPPYDCYIVAPFGGRDDMPREIENASHFYDIVLKKSPAADLWIYMQWEGVSVDKILVPNGEKPQKAKKTDWDKLMIAYVPWFEKLRDELEAKYPGKRVRIIPVGVALLQLKKEMAAGRVPGMTNLCEEFIRDGIHMTAPGSYFAGLVHFACLYGQSPEGLVVANTGLTPEQSRIFQKVAWDAVKNYKPNEEKKK